MISFSTMKKIFMYGFMPLYLWMKDVLYDEVVEKYNKLVQEENRVRKTTFLKIYIVISESWMSLDLLC